MNKSNFKLLYYDKNNKARDLILLHMDFKQNLFDKDEKFGIIDILAAGKIDRTNVEIFTDSAKEPILILNLYEDIPLNNIKGQFILPLYIRYSLSLGLFDGENTIYKFYCRPFVYAILNSSVTPFTLKISPEQDGKLPNIREIIEEFVSRQPPLLSTGKALIMPAYTKTYDLIKSEGSAKGSQILQTSQESSHETVKDVEVPEHVKPVENRFSKMSNELVEKVKDMEKVLTVEEIKLKNIPQDKIVKIERKTFGKTNISQSVNLLSERKDIIKKDIERIKAKKEDIRGQLRNILENFINFLNSICSVLSTGLNSISSSIGKLSAVISGFTQQIINRMEILSSYILNTLSSLSEFSTEFLKNMYDIARSAADEFLSLLDVQNGENCSVGLLNAASSFVGSIAALTSALISLPQSILESVLLNKDRIINSIEGLSKAPFPSIFEVISIFESASSDAYKNLCDRLSRIILLDPCKPLKEQNIINGIRGILDLLKNAFSNLFAFEEIFKRIFNRISGETGLIHLTRDYNVENIIRDIVNEEINKIISDLNEDKDKFETFFQTFIERSEIFLEDIRNSIPQDSEDRMEQALSRRVDELLQELSAIDINSITNLLNSESPLWEQMLSFLSDFLTLSISLYILNIQEALALLSYQLSSSSPSLTSGVLDPVKEIQIVFGVDEEEIKNFDEISKKIAKNLGKTIYYPVYEGTIYTALHKTISDLAPTPVSNYMSVVYYTKDGKSHAFIRYRLYPGQMEIGRSDIEISERGRRPIQFGPEFFITLQDAFSRKTGESHKSKININYNFAGFPSKKLKFTSSLNGYKFEVNMDVKEHFSHMVFCGSSLFSNEKMFLTVSLPGALEQTTELPVQLENLSYNGLLISKLFGKMSNSMLENPLIEQEVTFTGIDAYMFFLLLWTGDVLFLNISSLAEKSPFYSMSPHTFLPRFIITKKRFQYVNMDYYDKIKHLAPIETRLPFRIDFVLASNDDGMKTARSFSNHSYSDSVKKAYSVCVMERKRK